MDPQGTSVPLRKGLSLVIGSSITNGSQGGPGWSFGAWVLTSVSQEDYGYNWYPELAEL